MNRITRAAALALGLCMILCACSGGSGPAPAPSSESSAPEPEPQWWEELGWDAPLMVLEGEGLRAEAYAGGRLRLTLEDDSFQPQLPAGEAAWELAFSDPQGLRTTLAAQGDWDTAPEELEWSGHSVQDLSACRQEGKLVFYLRDPDLDVENITALWAGVSWDSGETDRRYYLAEEDGSLTSWEVEAPDFSDMEPVHRYMQLDTGEERFYLHLYDDGSFRLYEKLTDGAEVPTLWGEWEDGNTAITFWPAQELLGPGQEFRLEKTGGLRVYTGEGPQSLPLETDAAFQKIGDLLDLPLFDAAVVSMVVDGDRPAIYLDRAENAQLLDQFRQMMADAAELRNPQWTEDPADRPNIQFDLNINGEDITMVLCPCIVAGTEDKYLLVRKDSYMGRVTYTYYQTREGDDYDRMVALFDAQYAEDPQVLTAAMASQTRALTAAISNLDWSDEYPLDENGIPITYKAVLREQKATGYWRAGNAWGAGSHISQYKTGVYNCTAGTVAVRPEEIPYGSKLYIRSSSGSFSYGYAVANDTGSGLVDGLIDVDLFYDTYEESKLNSVRWVDIYILE